MILGSMIIVDHPPDNEQFVDDGVVPLLQKGELQGHSADMHGEDQCRGDLGDLYGRRNQ